MSPHCGETAFWPHFWVLITALKWGPWKKVVREMSYYDYGDDNQYDDDYQYDYGYEYEYEYEYDY